MNGNYYPSRRHQGHHRDALVMKLLVAIAASISEIDGVWNIEATYVAVVAHQPAGICCKILLRGASS